MTETVAISAIDSPGNSELVFAIRKTIRRITVDFFKKGMREIKISIGVKVLLWMNFDIPIEEKTINLDGIKLVPDATLPDFLVEYSI